MELGRSRFCFVRFGVEGIGSKSGRRDRRRRVWVNRRRSMGSDWGRRRRSRCRRKRKKRKRRKRGKRRVEREEEKIKERIVETQRGERKARKWGGGDLVEEGAESGEDE